MKKSPLISMMTWLLAASLLFSACAGETVPSAADPSAGSSQSAQTSGAETETAAPTSAAEAESSAEPETEAADAEDFDYAPDASGGLILTKYTGSKAEPVIPTQIDGSPVTAIGESCFAGLLCLERITVPEGVTVLGDYAFECCSRLKKIYLPDSLLSIGDGAFSGCASLVLADMQEGLQSIGRGAFMTCTELVLADLPASLTEIGAFAFSGCHNLASVVFNGDDLAVLPDRLFYDCPSLARVRLPQGVNSVGQRTFSGCEMLRSLYFPTPLTRVGAHAFEECTALQNVDLSVPVIESATFAGCSSMSYISLAEGTTSIGYRAFMTTGITDLDLPASLTDIEEGAFDLSKISSLTLADESHFKLIGSHLCTADGKTLLCCFPEDPYAEEPAEELTVPDGVEIIAGYAFSCVNGVSRVILPASVKEIRAFAFSDSTVTFVSVPKGAAVDPEAYKNSAMEEQEEDPVDPDQEEQKEQAPETLGSAAGDKSLFKEEDFEDYLTVTNEGFEAWSEKYLAYCEQFFPANEEFFPYTILYKGEAIPHFTAMTYVQNHDPDMWERASSQFGDDFEETYVMMNHGLFTELRRGRMCDDLVLFSGVYDSQLMAAAGTDTVPTQEQLVAAIGTTFTDPVMISTTTDPEVACGFSDTLFVIYASQAAMEDLGAISIDSILHTSENEILMCANASYRLLDVGTMAVEGLDEEGQPRTYYRNYVTVELLGAGE